MQDAEQHAFRFLGGRPSLDLTATVGERWRDGIERLRDPADLGRWLLEAGFAASPPTVTQQELHDARTLREALYRLCTVRGNGRPAGPGDIAVVNDWASRPPSRVWLAPAIADDPPRRAGVSCLVERRETATVAAALAEIARDAVSLLGGPLAHRVRECAGDECALLFLDASRGGRRRWCSMDACGARTKVAAYRARGRQRTAPAAA